MFLTKLSNKTDLKRCIDQLQTLLPRSFYMLQHLRLLLEFGFDDFEIYTAKRKHDSATCPVILSTMESDPVGKYAIFYGEEDLDLAVDVMGQKLDWTKRNFLHNMPDYQRPLLDAIITQKQNEIVFDTKCYFMVLNDVQKLPKLTSETISDTKEIVKRIEPELAGVINDNWKFRSEWSLDRIRRELQTSGGYGVFVDGRMASWIVISKYGDMGHLHTLADFRRRGYASQVIISTSRRMSDLGVTPFANVEVDNPAGKAMFDKLGFELLWNCSWLMLKPVYE